MKTKENNMSFAVWLKTESGDKYSYFIESNDSQEVVNYIKEQLDEELAWVYEWCVSGAQGSHVQAVEIEDMIGQEIKNLEYLMEE